MNAPQLFQRMRQSSPFFLIVGTNVVESADHTRRIAEHVVNATQHVPEQMQVIFKASWDKANRTSKDSFRGIGLEAGLKALEQVKNEFQLPILTDVHETAQVDAVAQVADIIQIPSFLCRQTDLLLAAGESGRVVNIKKGQFASVPVMHSAVEKVRSAGNEAVFVTERGTSFGLSDLVMDPRQLVWMRSLGCPVVADVTHAAQNPVHMHHDGTQALARSGGHRYMVPALARAAVAIGVDGVFLECHDDVARAPVDGSIQWPVEELPRLLDELINIAEASHGKLSRDT